jgi:hypothetical protein
MPLIHLGIYSKIAQTEKENKTVKFQIDFLSRLYNRFTNFRFFFLEQK